MRSLVAALPGREGRLPPWARARGFEGVTFHGLRHGAATLMLAAGVPDPVAVEIMGHADARVLARYQKVVHALRRDAARRMDELLGKSGSRSGSKVEGERSLRSVSAGQIGDPYGI